LEYGNNWQHTRSEVNYTDSYCGEWHGVNCPRSKQIVHSRPRLGSGDGWSIRICYDTHVQARRRWAVPSRIHAKGFCDGVHHSHVACLRATPVEESSHSPQFCMTGNCSRPVFEISVSCTLCPVTSPVRKNNTVWSNPNVGVAAKGIVKMGKSTANRGVNICFERMTEISAEAMLGNAVGVGYVGVCTLQKKADIGDGEGIHTCVNWCWIRGSMHPAKESRYR